MVSFNMLHLGSSLYHALKHMTEGGSLASVISMFQSMHNEPRCLAGFVSGSRYMRLDGEMHIEWSTARRHMPSCI